MRLTVQAGTFSNWVGSHFWGSISRTPSSMRERDRDFNEDADPRLFVIDTVEGMGVPEIDQAVNESISTTGSENPSTVSVHKVDISSHADVHPLRKLAIRGELLHSQFQLSSPFQLGELRSWSDFWELPDLPRKSMTVPSREFIQLWHEEPRICEDALDEGPLRKLLEETETGIDCVRLLVDSRFSGAAGDTACYLHTAMAKAKIHVPFSMMTDASSYVNVAALCVDIGDYSGHVSVFDFAIGANEYGSDMQYLHPSAVQSVWENSIRQDDHLPTAMPLISSPELTIDGVEQIQQTVEPCARFLYTGRYYKNLANPIAHLSGKSVIRYDDRFTDHTREIIGTSVRHVVRMSRIGTGPVETDEWTEMIENLKNLL